MVNRVATPPDPEESMQLDAAYAAWEKSAAFQRLKNTNQQTDTLFQLFANWLKTSEGKKFGVDEKLITNDGVGAPAWGYLQTLLKKTKKDLIDSLPPESVEIPGASPGAAAPPPAPGSWLDSITGMFKTTGGTIGGLGGAVAGYMAGSALGGIFEGIPLIGSLISFVLGIAGAALGFFTGGSLGTSLSGPATPPPPVAGANIVTPGKYPAPELSEDKQSTTTRVVQTPGTSNVYASMGTINISGTPYEAIRSGQRLDARNQPSENGETVRFTQVQIRKDDQWQVIHLDDIDGSKSYSVQSKNYNPATGMIADTTAVFSHAHEKINQAFASKFPSPAPSGVAGTGTMANVGNASAAVANPGSLAVPTNAPASPVSVIAASVANVTDKAANGLLLATAAAPVAISKVFNRILSGNNVPAAGPTSNPAQAVLGMPPTPVAKVPTIIGYKELKIQRELALKEFIIKDMTKEKDGKEAKPVLHVVAKNGGEVTLIYAGLDNMNNPTTRTFTATIQGSDLILKKRFTQADGKNIQENMGDIRITNVIKKGEIDTDAVIEKGNLSTHLDLTHKDLKHNSYYFLSESLGSLTKQLSHMGQLEKKAGPAATPNQ